MASVNVPPAKTGKAASEDEKRDFMTLFPDIIRDLTEIGGNSDIPDAQKWYGKVWTCTSAVYWISFHLHHVYLQCLKDIEAYCT